MFTLTRAKELPRHISREEYEELPEEEKEEVLHALEGGTDLVVNPENVVRILPHGAGPSKAQDGEAPVFPNAQARVEYVTGEQEIVTETPSDVKRLANRPMYQFRRQVENLRATLTRLQ